MTAVVVDLLATLWYYICYATKYSN